MPGKPFLHGSGLVNTVVIQDYVNSTRRVTGSDAFEKLDELNRTLSIEYLVDKASTADIQGAEDALLLVSARRRNPGLLAALHPHKPLMVGKRWRSHSS